MQKYANEPETMLKHFQKLLQLVCSASFHICWRLKYNCFVSVLFQFCGHLKRLCLVGRSTAIWPGRRYVACTGDVSDGRTDGRST